MLVGQRRPAVPPAAPGVTQPSGLGLSQVRRLLDAHGMRPSKALVQLFVVDPNTVERIARLARVGQGDQVVEIGPGLGSLTLALVATGAQVTAIEIDRRLVAVLQEVLPASVRLVCADASSLDFAAVLGEAPWVLVANLPYNVATPLVIRLLQRAPQILRMVVMVQREAGERLAARPGGRAYGAVSVRVAYYATTQLLGRVSPQVFYPPPHVESVLVELERRERPAVDPALVSFEQIDALVRAGFAGRRKMLRRSLAGLIGEAEFACAGVAPTARAEELSVLEWGKLAQCRRSRSNSRTPS